MAFKRRGSAAAAYLTASEAWAYMGLSKTLFYRMVAEFRTSKGKRGLGPAIRFFDRTVRFFKGDLDRCAHRYASDTVCHAIQTIQRSARRQKAKGSRRT